VVPFVFYQYQNHHIAVYGRIEEKHKEYLGEKD
jgi:hypothetical protein